MASIHQTIHQTIRQRSVASHRSPPRYKIALLTWAAAFPLLTALNVLFGPLLADLALPARTFLLTGVLIGLSTYVTMPWLSRRFANWLFLPGDAGGEKEKVAIAENPDPMQTIRLLNRPRSG